MGLKSETIQFKWGRVLATWLKLNFFFILIWHDSPKQYCKVRLYGIAFKHFSCVLLELPSLVKKREILFKCPAFLNFLEKLEN